MTPGSIAQGAPSEPTQIARLTPAAYAALVKGLPASGCPKSDLEAGFMCGVQHVLVKLRDGFVIGA